MPHPSYQAWTYATLIRDFNETVQQDHIELKPSKNLADHLSSLLQSNREFQLIVEGGPGTGKSVVAINLLVELTTREKLVHYVTRNAARCSVFFIDEDQRVTLKDIGTKEEIKAWAQRAGAKVTELALESQFRCNGSDGYLAWLDHVLQIRPTANTTLEDIDYDFRVCDSPTELRRLIAEKNYQTNKARIVAGYCWDWKGKKDPSIHDVAIPEHDFEMPWNLVKDGSLWAIAPNSVNEVGCIHTCQGLELDYVGVIIGPDLVVRDGFVVTDASKRSSQDQTIRGYKKMLKEDPERARALADRVIKNTYRTLMTRGQKGCFVYLYDKESEYFFNQARSANAQNS